MRYLAALTLAVFAWMPAGTATLWSQPANDLFANAATIPQGSVVRLNGTTTNATTDYLTYDEVINNTTYSTYAIYTRSVWYKWQAPAGGQVTLLSAPASGVIEMETITRPNPNELNLIDDVYAFTDSSTYTFTVTAGETYYTSFMRVSTLSSATASGEFAFLQSYTPVALSDTFASRTQLFGKSLTINGSNSNYTQETGEPDHAAASQNSAKKSAWMTWRSPDSRKTVSLEVRSTLFAPVIAVYTGDTLETLKVVARSRVSTDRTGSVASVTFVAEDAVDYHFAVDGAKGGAGEFTFSLSSTTARPGFVLQPIATIVTQGETAVFTVAAAYTGDTVSYQWERLPAGASQWAPLSDDEIFSGTGTSTLAVLTSLVMNNDRYRVKATDSVATTASRTAQLTVTEFSAVGTEVLGTIGGGSATTLNIASGTILAPTNGGVYFATGLPKGLSIDPVTGEITGVVTAKPGTYKVVYGSTDGTKKNALTYTVQIVVAPFSSDLQGSFEALLTSPDALVLPEGKLTMKVTATGSFTGSYLSLDENKSYSFRGTLVLNQEERTAGNPAGAPVSISRGKILPPLRLNFTIAEPADADGDSVLSASLLSETDTLLAQSFDGVHIGVFNAANPAAWAGTYTGFLSDVQKTDPTSLLPIPSGSGTLSVTVTAKSGMATLRGRSAEGVPFTGKMSSSAEGSYRLAQRVFSGTGGQIAGSFKFSEQLTSVASAYNVPEDAGTRVYLRKPAVAKDRVYPLGYDTLSYLFSLESWVKPGTGLLLPSLGLAEGGAVTIVVDAPGVSNTDANERGLPVNLSIGTSGKVVVTDINNTSKLTLSLNVTNGTFSGYFNITDPATPPAVKPVVRKVTVAGSLVQKPIVVEGTVIGSGYLLLPPLPGDTDKTFKAGTFKILAGAPSLPF